MDEKGYLWINPIFEQKKNSQKMGDYKIALKGFHKNLDKSSPDSYLQQT